MNICLVSQEYPPETARGGIGTQTWNKARSLSRLGHTVHVLTCASAEGPDLRSESCSGVMVHRCNRQTRGPAGSSRCTVRRLTGSVTSVPCYAKCTIL